MVIEQGDSVAWIHTSALATEPDMAPMEEGNWNRVEEKARNRHPCLYLHEAAGYNQKLPPCPPQSAA